MTEENAVCSRAVADHFAGDRAARTMGIELVDSGAGYAAVAFVVREEMLNHVGFAHGGYIFALADTAFAYACNSRGDTWVASNASITYSAPGRCGMRLTATARERSRGGRTGLYDVEVVDDAGAVVAFFRGSSYRINNAV